MERWDWVGEWMDTWKTSLVDQPAGKCVVSIVASGAVGSSPVYILAAMAKFWGCGCSDEGHTNASSAGCCLGGCSVMTMLVCWQSQLDDESPGVYRRLLGNRRKESLCLRLGHWNRLEDNGIVVDFEPPELDVWRIRPPCLVMVLLPCPNASDGVTRNFLSTELESQILVDFKNQRLVTFACY